ncbi:hypothetical protein [Methylicorpusculum sp.]|uniref:hypothetical protein n=1 Tax=Methylicorpusculum sp. TaxID=2713644 RepID=UPI002ABB815B|nr:hypothetical protein [Methylicorpusculum sp.]MDZ4151003.1 hypothetical protein [Methylicorpusculum sp.]
MILYRLLLLALFSISTKVAADHLSGGIGLPTSAAPFWTATAQTMPAGQMSFGLSVEYQKLRPFSDQKLQALRQADALANPQLYQEEHNDEHAHADPRQADLHSVDYLLGGNFRFAYGVTDDLSVGLNLPFVHRNNVREAEGGVFDHGEFDSEGVADHGNSEGIGDMSFWGQYRFYDDSISNASLILGFKAPTGETTNTGYEDERLETHLQPGSGSWDGMFGLAYGYDLGTVMLNTSVLYTLATEGSQATTLGDGFNYNFAVSMPVHAIKPCSACYWNLVMELNGDWRDSEERRGITIGNSGGHTVYLSPGIRFIGGENWNIGVAGGYAVIHDLNGDQSEPDYRFMGTMNMGL